MIDSLWRSRNSGFHIRRLWLRFLMMYIWMIKIKLPDILWGHFEFHSKKSNRHEHLNLVAASRHKNWLNFVDNHLNKISIMDMLTVRNNGQLFIDVLVIFWLALPVDVIRNTGKENSAGKDKNQTREKLRLWFIAKNVKVKYTTFDKKYIGLKIMWLIWLHTSYSNIFLGNRTILTSLAPY